MAAPMLVLIPPTLRINWIPELILTLTETETWGQQLVLVRLEHIQEHTLETTQEATLVTGVEFRTPRTLDHMMYVLFPLKGFSEALPICWGG